MKKRYFIIFAIIILCAGAFSACSAFCKHEYGIWEIVKEATCYEKGERSHTCAACGKTEKEEIALSDDHDLKDQVCQKCGLLIYEKFTVTSKNLAAIGYTGQTEFEIPNIFQDQNGIYYEVVAIGNDAFSEMSELTSVTIPDSVISIGEAAFEGTKLLDDPKNWENDILYIGKHLIATKHEISGKHTIREGTLTVADHAFEGRWDVTEISLPEGVRNIGKHAFSECPRLEKISLSNGLIDIDDYAFANCTAITEIRLPNTVTRIGNNAFFGCHRITEIAIPRNITVLEDYLLTNCSTLKKVKIPAGVTSIGLHVFQYCEKLERIEFAGSKAQWKAIPKGDYWDDRAGSFTVICTDGTIQQG